MLNRAYSYILKNSISRCAPASKGTLVAYKPTAFKSRVPAEIWKKMSYDQRSAHKLKQVIFKKNKRILKVKLAAGRGVAEYNATDRKFSKRRRFHPKVEVFELDTAVGIKKTLQLGVKSKNPAHRAREVYAWKHGSTIRGVKILKKHRRVKKSFKQLFTVLKFPCPVNKKLYKFPETGDTSNKIICWSIYLPIYYIFPVQDYKSIVISENFIQLLGDSVSMRVDKRQYGCIVFVNNFLDTAGEESIFTDYEILRSCQISPNDLPNVALKESSVVGLYSNLISCTRSKFVISTPKNSKLRTTANLQDATEKRGYLKHVIRMRYRWFFQPRLSQFKLFKKFFKRSLKRYRKINKDKLFVSKLRSHFPKLTGFTERGLLQMWVPFRRGYNQYWSATNAVLRFSQSMLLAPVSLLVFLQLSPSFAASRYIVKSGAVSINGLAVTAFTQFRPGDIMQLNFVIWKSVRHFFDYQKWNDDFRPLQHVSFLQIDWSSLMFMMVRWPRKYELVAPSFLSERWVRYYIRHFPSKIRNFRKADGNWKVYKRIITKR